MVQNMNKMVNALAKALIMFMTRPIFEASKANIEKKAPSIWNNGAPGGCPTCNLEAVRIYSPASQKLTVGSTVRLYVIKAMKNENHPRMVFHFLKLSAVI